MLTKNLNNLDCRKAMQSRLLVDLANNDLAFDE